MNEGPRRWIDHNKSIGYSAEVEMNTSTQPGAVWQDDPHNLGDARRKLVCNEHHDNDYEHARSVHAVTLLSL